MEKTEEEYSEEYNELVKAIIKVVKKRKWTLQEIIGNLEMVKQNIFMNQMSDEGKMSIAPKA